MAPSSTGPDVPDQLRALLAGHLPAISGLTLDVRSLLLGAVGGLSERINNGWHSVSLHHPEAGYVCGIFPRQDEVKVGFERGHLLYDPDRLLSGTGRQLRYLAIPALTPDLAGHLIDFLHQALDLSSH